MRGFRIELGEIEATLRQHPAVDACAVTVARSESSGDSWLVGHVVPAVSDRGAGADSDSEWLNDVVQQFESGYRAAISENAGSGEAVQDPTLNIYAWSGLERTEQEVAQWVDGIANRIMPRRPKRLLEIGCGTGLLVFRLAPQVREYWATDISQAALDDIQRRLGPAGLSEAQVKLSRQMAHDISNLPAAFFDGVLLNGVIEYFPSADYLLQVLNGVLQLLAPGGFIFFGAVPNLAVQDVFHVWEELLRAGDAEDPGALQQRARNRVAADRRLLVSPEFFRALPKETPQITRIDIRTLGGCFENEASKLVADTSFDAILSIGEWSEEERTVQRFDWEQEHLNPAEVARRLQETRGDIFHVSRVPHGRMRQRRRVLGLLRDPVKTVGEWRKLLASDAVEPGLMELLDTCRNLPFLTDVTWSNSGSDGLCDVVFYRRGQQEPMVGQEPRLGNEQLRAHTNEPRQARLVRELVPELRRFLQAKLPGHMVPARFVLLDKLPLLPNGKVDRHALPSPDLAVEAAGDLSAAPGTPAERALAQIWCDLLRLKQVGIHDNFFDLGGHSLLVTQVIARIQSQFGVELPMRRMFEQPTIAGLAAAVEQGLAEEVEELSEAEAERLAAGSFAR
jgi:SAM-dependent methyltransferase/acyl carrier protein